MTLHILGLELMSHDEATKLRAAAGAIGHEVAGFAASETDKLIAAVKTKYPDVVTRVQKLIADAASANSKGTDKLEAVAMDTVGLLPSVLSALPDAKTFAIGLVQSVFADGKAELEKVAAEILAKL